MCRKQTGAIWMYRGPTGRHVRFRSTIVLFNSTLYGSMYRGGFAQLENILYCTGVKSVF